MLTGAAAGGLLLVSTRTGSLHPWQRRPGQPVPHLELNAAELRELLVDGGFELRR